MDIDACVRVAGPVSDSDATATGIRGIRVFGDGDGDVTLQQLQGHKN